MDLRATDGLVTTLMNAKLMLTIVVFMHYAITLSAPTVVSVTRDFWGMDDPVRILMNAIPIKTIVVITQFAITPSAPTHALVNRDS